MTGRLLCGVALVAHVFVLVICTECGENEEIQCVHSCPPQRSCSNRDIGISCTQEYTLCSSTCVCKSGYIRDENYECVPEEQCEICTKENEFYDCGALCDNVCATLTTQNRTNCKLWNPRCVRKCYCKDGYARDDNKNCVPVEECP
uniref:TIL domain-containing protein n=1 Tax=Heliothis virescens TaxID=7102 RepID=A0A2A4J0S7_HELVI